MCVAAALRHRPAVTMAAPDQRRMTLPAARLQESVAALSPLHGRGLPRDALLLAGG